MAGLGDAVEMKMNVVYRAACGVVDGQWVDNPWLAVNGAGMITATGRGAYPDGGPPDGILTRDLGPVALLPGLVNAHSHAFQRAIRGSTHRRHADAPSSFWSWREAMYRYATTLDPEGVFAITRQAFAEMLQAGITCVGEFHYLHHQPNGQRYADPNELSLQVARAAETVGIRLVLLEVFYARAGHNLAPKPEQRRFCDKSVDAYLRRVDDLRTRGLAVGLAPHSVRAVPLPALRELAAYGLAHQLPMHTHLSEQPRENAECQAEHGTSPAAVFAKAGFFAQDGAFTAVHAVHTTAEDHRLLCGQQVCACPTTEADLGDGIVPAVELRAAGVSVALGSDSNAVIDLIQEARLLEMNERLRGQARLRLCDDGGDLGRALLAAATDHGARALRQSQQLGSLAVGRPFDACTVALDHPSLIGVAPEHVLDAVLTTGTAALIRHVFVGGEQKT